jgi:predicted dithiol-disulfide oxidoreductase (DUF899 family)
MATQTNEKVSRKTIEDYVLQDNEERPVKLSSLFGQHEHLIVLHNMGSTCPNCALWGDEFNGMLYRLERAAAFCIVGPDDPKTQKAYVKERGWKASLYSAQGSSFIKDMGFEDKDGNTEPGVSVLQKGKNGKITILEQVNVCRDDRCPSVLEVIWILPYVKPAQLAWKK